jgi:uncharacterized membrane protein YphA (DoxX/SURF4 family)
MMSDSKSNFRRLDEFEIPFPFIVRLFLGGHFVYMGVNKIIGSIEFLKQINLYEMLPSDPPHFLNATAIVLPWMEVLCGMALILGVWIRGGATQIAILLCVFTPAIFLRALAIHNADGTPFLDIEFDCGCGGGPVIIWKKLLSNTGLFLLAWFALFSQSRRLTVAKLLQDRAK